MKTVLALTMIMAAGAALAQEGPADRLWELYKEGRFEDVVREGKVELTTGTPTAQVNLAVGRALVDLERPAESLVYLEAAVRQDPGRTWVYAWAKNYLGSAHMRLGNRDQARAAWIEARDCEATANAARYAVGSLKTMGLTESYDDWPTFSTEHFEFRFSPNLSDFDVVNFARKHEQAYRVIATWFGGGPAGKIDFFVWADKAEGREAGLPPLGFAYPDFNLVHAATDQTIGHEMTHVISAHALRPRVVVGLINEGAAVFHDQTSRDRLAMARRAIARAPADQVRVSLAALWEDWSLLPDEISYPVAGAWIRILVVNGGREKFLEFFADQSLDHARRVYGQDLQTWLEDFDAELTR